LNLKSKKFYLNPGQRYIYELAPRLLTAICARRFGKTHGIAAPFLARIASNLPRCKSAIYALTFKQALTRTIPTTIAALQDITGWREGIHFFIGHAPKAAHFPEPLIRPLNWEHCIHFYNGHTTHILSQDVKFSANSLTLDAVLADEARSMRKQKIDEELTPAVSGTPGLYNHFPLKKAIWMLSDRPLLRSENWILERERDATPDIEKQLLHAIHLYTHAAARPASFNPALLRTLLDDINHLRRTCHLFKEYDTLENLDLVGEDYIRDMRRILPARIFNISILNIRQKRQADGYYPAFDTERHTFIPQSAPALEQLRTTAHPHGGLPYETFDLHRIRQNNCLLDTDIDPRQPLNISLDYNAAINWIVTAQRHHIHARPTLLVLSSFFVKNDRKLRELCTDWANYYEPHRLRNARLNYFYNQTAKQRRYANNNLNEPFHETVRRELTARGWNVNPVDMGAAMPHNDKFFFLIDAMNAVIDPLTLRQRYIFPLLNRENNEFLIAALENTGRRFSPLLGVQKDKSEEKLADSEDNPSELRTDGTDAFDDLLIGINSFYHRSTPVLPSLNFPQ
jgi:hypothetical protein